MGINIWPQWLLNYKVQFCAFVLAILFLKTESDKGFYSVFLNSYAHCGHDNFLEVKPDQGFVLLADVSPHTGTKTFRNCETNFYSKRDDGRLCIVQEGRVSEIGDPNAELLIHDGHDTDESPQIFALGYQGRWLQREYCTQSRYVNFYLRSINRTARVDIRKVFINLKILDIESRERQLYLDDTYCEHSYDLYNSQVSIFNMAPAVDLSLRNVSDSCNLEIHKNANNKSICFVYIPSNQLSCDSNWMVSILSPLQNAEYALKCTDHKAKQLHAWCGRTGLHSLTFRFQRGNNSFSEVPEMFRYVFADYQGSPDSLLEKIKRELSVQTGNDGISAGWVVFIVLALIVIVAAVALFCWKQRLLPCLQYKAVHNPGNAALV
ncbi:unnamed protein product [Candidula unifasciata]|uniref:Uncharacterized protein n=1 Tax=Candidula unifasciata TaxID=100452 RepID=A0A8S3ZVZ3_9EUPU|nr:unnamed protein product [Candidula unifasciata]